jgi:NAD+ synthase (glutamine-hydrolysing)
MKSNFLQLSRKLTALRNERAFKVNEYLDAKSERLKAFFKSSGIDAIVIGLSGGVDSALVAELMCKIANEKKSPLKKVSAIIAPILGLGTSGQESARERAEKQCQALAKKSKAFEYQIADLSASYQAMLSVNNFKEQNAWAEGQMASVLRTPFFYYQAAILQQKGFRSIVCGTTNRDEGAYIGFFGKASDAMVDIQPIADLHKSEVIKLAENLDVIPEIVSATPRGDVWDGKTDEEMIGAPYWFLEMYQLLLCKGEVSKFELSLENPDKDFFKKCKENIERLHKINSHKYHVGNPAHFIDFMERKVPGGWS